MTANNLCVICGKPTADGYACHADALRLSQSLQTAAGHAEDAETVLSRQARYGSGARGASAEPLPVDLATSARLTTITTTVDHWTHTITRETRRTPRWRPTTGPLCPPTSTRCDHDSCAALRRTTPPPKLALQLAWIATQTDTLRKHPAAQQAFHQLDDACTNLAQLVDRPPDKNLVGMCDCGKILYAPHGKTTVTCPITTCKLRWNVTTSRNILRNALDGKLVTAAEAARLAAYLDTDRNQQQIRKLINAWSSRTLVAAHGEIDGEPTFRFGDIALRLAGTVKRTPRADAA